MKPIKLSICICSTHERARLLARLLERLSTQHRIDEVQILVNTDAGQQNVGVKRNYLLFDTIGEYIVYIDDDDLVSENYIPRILAAIDQNSGVTAIAISGVRTDIKAKVAPVRFNYTLMTPNEGQTDKDGVLWRSPGHLCPIRADIARSVSFPEVEPEDLAWAELIGPKLTSVISANHPDEDLYLYLWDSEKVARWQKPSQDQITADHQPAMARWYVENSGPGSTLEFTAPYRAFVERLVIENRIRFVYDLGCGDGVVANAINWHGATYLGVDVVRERIERNIQLYPKLNFTWCDLRSATPSGDLVIVKDVIQHWATSEILRWLADFKKRSFRYALITNCNYGPTVNTDTPTGGWRAIDLTKPPFSIGEVVFSWGQPNKDVVLLKGATR